MVASSAGLRNTAAAPDRCCQLTTRDPGQVQVLHPFLEVGMPADTPAVSQLVVLATGEERLVVALPYPVLGLVKSPPQERGPRLLAFLLGGVVAEVVEHPVELAAPFVFQVVLEPFQFLDPDQI